MDCVLFRGIPEREIRLLLRALAKEKRFAKGEIIYSPQDFKRSLGIICKGSVVAQKENGVTLLNFDFIIAFPPVKIEKHTGRRCYGL